MARIFNQIETTADYHNPATYVQLLTHYHTLETQEDSLAEQFIPITAVRPNTKLFAVGIIPPAVNITGRILDRSATVANLDPTALQPEQGSPVIPEPPPTRAPSTTVDQQFWIDYVLMCRRIKTDPRELAKVWLKESSFNPSATSKGSGGAIIAKGFGQVTKQTAVALGMMTAEEWNSFDSKSGSEQLPYWETFLVKSRQAGKKAATIYANNAGGYNHPGFGKGYMSQSLFNSLSSAQQQAIRDALGNRLGGSFAGYTQNPNVDKEPPIGFLNAADLTARIAGPLAPHIAIHIDRAEEALANGAVPASPVGDAGGAGDWKGEGSDAAQAALKERSKTEGSSLNTSELGQKFMAAQVMQILEAKITLEAMKRTPPLKMLVNPRSFGVKGSKIVTDGNWSRNGHIIEHWGDEQDTISASGKLAAFYAMSVEDANGPGMTRTAKNYSASWMNFMSLYMLYQNNGGMYLTDHLDVSEIKGRNLSLIGSIYIYYDNILYVGSFSTFTITEDETNPFSVEYSFEFSVRASFLLDRTDDQFTYGAPSLFQKDVPVSSTPPLPSRETGDGAVPPPPTPGENATPPTESLGGGGDKSNVPTEAQ